MRLRRGGARNKRDRETWQLSEHDCRKILAGADAAWEIGAPFNRFATLAWQLGGFAPQDCVRLTGQFINLSRDWLAARGHSMPWVWTQERGDKYGAHAHALFHVPPELDLLFRPMPQRWAKHLLGGTYVKGVVQCQSLASRRAAYSNPEFYWAELRGKLRYMLKSAPAELEGVFGMIGWGNAPWGQSCKTYGKRAGVWQYRQARRG